MGRLEMDRPESLLLTQLLYGVGFLPPCLLSFEKFLDTLLSNAQSANQRYFRVIIVVETRYVLFVRARDGLFRLHHFHGIGDTRTETIARLNQRLLRQVNVAACHIHLIRRRLQVQQRRAHVGIDLGAQILQALAALLQSRVGLQDISVNAAP